LLLVTWCVSLSGRGILTESDLVRAFLSGRNERTVKAYSQDLADFQAFMGAGTVDEAAKVLLANGHGPANATALAYKTHLLERGLQSATVNRRLAALRSLVQLARIMGLVPWHLEVRNVKSEPFRDTRGPGKQGFRALLQELDGKLTPKAIRDRCALRLLYDLALRCGEVVSLDVEDVDIAQATAGGQGKRENIKTGFERPRSDPERAPGMAGRQRSGTWPPVHEPRPGQ
jgi:integrase/recombinase XerC